MITRNRTNTKEPKCGGHRMHCRPPTIKTITAQGPRAAASEVHRSLCATAIPLMPFFQAMTKDSSDTEADLFLGNIRLLCWLILA